MPSTKTMNPVTKIVGAVHMFAAFLKVKDLGTGARIFMYKTLFVSLSNKVSYFIKKNERGATAQKLMEKKKN